jgi:hypothetical protein
VNATVVDGFLGLCHQGSSYELEPALEWLYKYDHLKLRIKGEGYYKSVE